MPDNETKSEFYIPVMFTLALCNFIDNCIDDITSHKPGDTVQKNGKRYKISKNTGHEIEMVEQKKHNATITSHKPGPVTIKLYKSLKSNENNKISDFSFAAAYQI